MGKKSRKRRYSEENSDSDYYVRQKIRKLEKKLRRRKCRSSSSSSDNSHGDIVIEGTSVNAEEHHVIDLEFIDPLIMEDPDSLDNQNTELSEPTVRSVVSVAQSAGSVVLDQPPTTSTPETSAHFPEVDSETAPELDQDILDLLGEKPSKEKAYGAKIHNDLAVRWNHIVTTGLTKDARKELIGKNLIPENCTNIDAPILNEETKAALSDVLLKKDKALENKQKERLAAISCLGQALTRILEVGIKDTTILRPLLDAAKLICDIQHTDSMIRRSFICSSLKKEVKDRLYATEIDKFLFSEKLPDILKAGKAIQKSGAEMKVSSFKSKKPSSSNRPLNPRPPLPASRPSAGVSRKHEPAQTAQRRRAPFPPPPLPPAPAHLRQLTRSQPRAPRNH